MPDQITQSNESKSDRFFLLVGIIFIALIYFNFPSHRYFPDSLDYAWRMETKSDWVVHPHHPIFPLLPQMIFRAIGGMSSGFSGLDILTIWSILAGIAACIFMAMILKAAKLTIGSILAGLMIFAFSRGVWYFGATPNQNSTALFLGILVLLSTVNLIIESRDDLYYKNIIAIGILTGISILASKANAGLILPALYAIFIRGNNFERRIKGAIGYIALSAVIAIGITVLLVVFFTGTKNLVEFRAWQESYVYDPKWWAHGVYDSIRRSFEGIIGLHLASALEPYGLFGKWFQDFRTPIWYARLLLRFGQAFVILFLFFETIRALVGFARTKPRSTLQAIGLLAMLPVFLFSFVFTPDYVNYRILYLPGYLLFLMPSLERIYDIRTAGVKKTWPILLLIASLFFTNFLVKFYPESDPGNNPYIGESAAMAEVLGPGDLYILPDSDEGYLRSQYVRYHTHCDYILSSDLLSRIQTHETLVFEKLENKKKEGKTVLLHQDVLSEHEVDLLLQPGQTDEKLSPLGEFFNKYTDFTSHFNMNGKKIIYIVPLESPTPESQAPSTFEDPNEIGDPE